jgi:hypothetical protein
VDADTVRPTAADPRVFRNLDLTAASVDRDDPALASDVEELYRRLLAREPSEEELELTKGLADPVDGVSPTARDVAKMACYAVATSTEFLFH